MSCAGPRWSSLGGREGRKRSGAAGSRRRLAHRSSGGGSGVLGFRGGDLARKREKQNEGVLLVLLRARGGEPGHCPGLATAAARWRPSGARVCVAETGKLQREGKGRRGARARYVGRLSKQEVACGRPSAAGMPLCAGDKESREAERWKTMAGLVCNFRKV